MNAEQVREILKQYQRHGWNLRRVLLSAETSENVSASLFEKAEIIASELNAVWFARSSDGGREAWELRYLGTTPFALVEVFEEDDEEEVREETRREMETRLAEQASKAASRKSKN